MRNPFKELEKTEQALEKARAKGDFRESDRLYHIVNRLYGEVIFTLMAAGILCIACGPFVFLGIMAFLEFLFK